MGEPTKSLNIRMSLRKLEVIENQRAKFGMNVSDMMRHIIDLGTAELLRRGRIIIEPADGGASAEASIKIAKQDTGTSGHESTESAHGGGSKPSARRKRGKS